LVYESSAWTTNLTGTTKKPIIANHWYSLLINVSVKTKLLFLNYLIVKAKNCNTDVEWKFNVSKKPFIKESNGNIATKKTACILTDIKTLKIQK